MLRKLGFVAIAAVGLWMGQGNSAQADHYCHQNGYSSGYRPQVAYYGVPSYSTYRPPYYGGYSGRPVYGGGYPGNYSYFGSGYGSGINAPWGGYGMGGFPRGGSYGGGTGFSLYMGR